MSMLSRNGEPVPALRDVLTSSSRVFERMFAEHTQEASSGVVKTDATRATVEFFVRKLHCPHLAYEGDWEVLLGACELASHWELAAVLSSAVKALEGNLDARSAPPVLASASKQSEADAASTDWKNLVEAAAEALARTMPDSALQPAFKTLGFNEILRVISHVEESKVTLPTLTVDITAESSDCKGASSSIWRPAYGSSDCKSDLYRLASRVTQGNLGLFVDRVEGQEKPQMMEMTIQVNGRTKTCADAKVMSTWPIGQEHGWSNFLSSEDMLSVATEGKITVCGTVTVTAQQCQADVLMMWMLATNLVKEPLGPAQLLLFLRAYACDFDVTSADEGSLKKKLSEFGLEDLSGDRDQLQTCLRDEMHAALPIEGHLGSACRALAELTAASYPTCVADGSLFELDAAAFSMVLKQDNLVVENETAVLEHAMRYLSLPGRTDETVSRVMPLVRFPLVSLLHPATGAQYIMLPPPRSSPTQGSAGAQRGSG